MRTSKWVRVTVRVRRDLYERLRDDPRGMSTVVCHALDQEYGRDSELFGTTPKGLRFSDVRDHRDRV